MARLHEFDCPGWYLPVPRAICTCPDPETRILLETQTRENTILAIQRYVDAMLDDYDGLHICRSCYYGVPAGEHVSVTCPRCAACSWLYYPVDVAYMVSTFSHRAMQRFAAMVNRSSEVMYGKSIEP
jgi:hypothetical protein